MREIESVRNNIPLKTQQKQCVEKIELTLVGVVLLSEMGNQ